MTITTTHTKPFHLALILMSLAAGRTSAQTRNPVSEYWSAISSARSFGAASQVARPTGSDETSEIADGLLKFREYEFTLDRTAALIAIRDLENKLVYRVPES